MRPRVRLAFEQSFGEVLPFLAVSVFMMLLSLFPGLPGWVRLGVLVIMILGLVVTTFRVALRWQQLERDSNTRSFIPLESLDERGSE